MNDAPSFVVTAEEDGSRLDRIVKSRWPDLSRRDLSDLFRAGAVRIEGRAAAKGDVASIGTEVALAFDPALEPLPDPEASLDVRYESASVIVFNKAAGRPTAPVTLGERGTLVNALVARYPEMRAFGHRRREPGILHRLDTQTSGLVVAARTTSAFERLRGSLEAGRWNKRYLAIVAAASLGDDGVVDAPLGPDPTDSRRVSVLPPDAPGARPSTTEWRTLRRGRELALVEASVHRAYRHQVRVHLAAVGHPIVGDRTYGGPEIRALGARHALHATYVAWAGDEAVEGFSVEEPLPSEMAALIAG